MTREQKAAINCVGYIFKAYLENCPEETEGIFKKWKRGLITGDEVIRELMKKALPER